MLSDDEIATIEKTLYPADRLYKPLLRLRVNGVFVCINGKYEWENRAHLKCALISHLKHGFSPMRQIERDRSVGFRSMRESDVVEWLLEHSEAFEVVEVPPNES